MKKLTLSLVTILLFVTNLKAQHSNPAYAWFEEARFGMFIHFGPYSVLGSGEWVMEHRPVKWKEYKKLQNFFNPQDFDAKEWVSTAKDAGMKYITFTSRHHDGFSNWNTKLSDWNIMNTPHFGRDLIKELADECHKEGIKLIFYYSLLDWGRDDYQYWTGNTGQRAGRTEKGDWESYINFMKGQLTELLTNYGDIAGIWFDGDWDQHPKESKSHKNSKVDWHYKEIYELIHTLQPNCMISNNHHKEPIEGEDYQAFERDLPGENKGGYSEGQMVVDHMPQETCETMNKTWGYNITDDKFKSVPELIHYLVKASGYGVNLLLNVGPMPNGKIQPECEERLEAMGDWLKKYGESVYETRAGVFKPQEWGAATQKGNIHYIHIFNGDNPEVTFDLPGKVKTVEWMNSDLKPVWKQDKKTNKVILYLEAAKIDPIDSILKIVVQ